MNRELKNLRYVYINMDKDVDRKNSFLKEFPDVDWWRFPGCEGGLMWGEIARGVGMLGNLRVAGRERLTSPRWGNVGCSISHMFCLKLASVADGIVLFPDDVLNTKGVNLKTLVENALEHRPEGVGWIKLKNHRPFYAKSEDALHTSGGYTFKRLASFPRDLKKDSKNRLTPNTGSAAVIILKEQAEAILRALPPITSNHFDFELRAIVDKVPGGCWQMLDTGITHGGKQSARIGINRQPKYKS
jgi:hypothetical protein